MVIDKEAHTLSKIYFIADVRKYQVITLGDFDQAGAVLAKEVPDILVINCDLYKGDVSSFITMVKRISSHIRIIGCSWCISAVFKRKSSPFTLDAFIKLPMDVRKFSLAMEAIEYDYAMFPLEMFNYP
ncbi:hypothetical protein AwEntero_29030 [Enterobacterales bacterium]|nr:hypothetical protein AwEntero_29030 [Enterobacterales bacterium]